MYIYMYIYMYWGTMRARIKLDGLTPKSKHADHADQGHPSLSRSNARCSMHIKGISNVTFYHLWYFFEASKP